MESTLQNIRFLGPIGDKLVRLQSRAFPRWLCKILAVVTLAKNQPYVFKLNQIKEGEVVRLVTIGDATFFMCCNLASAIDRHIAAFGHWEPQLSRIAAQFIRKDSTVLDIGANIGYHSLVFSEFVGEGGKVVAYEPAENVRASLEKNIQFNGKRNIVLEFSAVSNQSRSAMPFYQSVHANKGLGSLNLNNDITDESKQNVACIALDDRLSELQNVSLIKIDIQGHEYEALEGMKSLIATQKPVIIFEFEAHYHIDAASQKFLNFFKLLDYKLFAIRDEFLVPCDDVLLDGDVIAIPHVRGYYPDA